MSSEIAREEDEEDSSSSEEEEVKESKYSEIWNERLEQLKEYKAQNGHCNVSTIDEGNKALGGWVSKQRRQYKRMLEGLKSSMTEEKVKKLENIGFEWSLRKNTTVKRHSKKRIVSKNTPVNRSSKKRVASKNTAVKRRSKRLRSRKSKIGIKK
ncbi:hypothetical protein CTEN210_18416 [Chaetoceros tenuissimus]|uniref:Helicase-associated domain-containing protein n=1 Tax=Chaetoceros tenuissimus TaxID=426638 RepID=A0AAD3HFP4_9STRA|nr:hypothetical protein CTEN210_18416 [Chaetoceros tenuissimus]